MSTINRWLILATVSSALLLIVLDTTILYTALPRLTHDLAATAAEKLWIVNAYPLVMAGLLPTMGTLGDRFGHKRFFTYGLITFGLASLIAAFSPEPTILIAARVLLAVGAAMMMPATLSIIRVTFSDAKERALAIGVWSSVSAGGAGLGPIVGGLLLEHYSWGSVFLINLPIVILLVPHMAGNRDKKFDWTGSVQIMIGLVGIVYAIKEITRRGGSTSIALSVFLIGLVSLIFFIRRQRRSVAPLLDLTLFKNPTFAIVYRLSSDRFLYNGYRDRLLIESFSRFKYSVGILVGCRHWYWWIFDVLSVKLRVTDHLFDLYWGWSRIWHDCSF